MLIVETPVFTRCILALLADDQYRQLQQVLALRPETGALISGGGGLRKIRWSAEGRGKRGGIRAIYYWAMHSNTIVMLYAYPKNKRENLTSKELKILRKIIEEEYHE